MDEADQDDYMSDAVLLACSDQRPGLFKSSSDAHKRNTERKQEDGRHKNMQKPLKVREAENREEGLNKELGGDNKGFALLQKMGFKPGMALGKSGQGRTVPISIEVKADRGGLGKEAEKRKREQEAKERRKEMLAKRAKLGQVVQQQYISSKSNEHRLRAVHKYLVQSQKVCEQLDCVKGITEPDVPYFWPLCSRPQKMVSVESETPEVERVDSEEEDAEEPDVEQQLTEITHYLRTQYLYCIWCGYAFDDAESLQRDCPGNKPEDHDDL